MTDKRGQEVEREKEAARPVFEPHEGPSGDSAVTQEFKEQTPPHFYD